LPRVVDETVELAPNTRALRFVRLSFPVALFVRFHGTVLSATRHGVG
jgi:hypothetical protein